MTDPARHAEPCPMCEVSDFLTTRNVHHADSKRQKQVVCQGCDMAGPSAPTAALAYGAWAALPRE